MAAAAPPPPDARAPEELRLLEVSAAGPTTARVRIEGAPAASSVELRGPHAMLVDTGNVIIGVGTLAATGRDVLSELGRQQQLGPAAGDAAAAVVVTGATELEGHPSVRSRLAKYTTGVFKDLVVRDVCVRATRIACPVHSSALLTLSARVDLYPVA